MKNPQPLTRIALALLRFATSLLPVITFFLSVGSLVLSGAAYEGRLAEYVLPLYPRYQQGQEGLRILQDRKYPARGDGGAEMLVGILDIDHPSWRVMLDFIQSEIAIRKSERNEPGPAMFTPPTAGAKPPKPVELPPIDFGRIKTITSLEVGTIKAGPKPLAPPFRLIVLFPHGIARRVYEFLSFQEFRLDLRQMLVSEIRFGSILVSAFSLCVSALLSFTRWLVQRFAPQLLVPPSRVATREVSPATNVGAPNVDASSRDA